MFKRTASIGSPSTPSEVASEQPHLSLTLSAEAHEVQGYLYCAALSAFRALGGVETGRDADYLFATLSNLRQIAIKLHVADADLADIAQWTTAAEVRMRELRRRAEFQQGAHKPLVQIDASMLEQEERREIA